MEDVTAVHMVDPMVAINNGGDDVLSENAIASVCAEETLQQINEDVARISIATNDDELNAEPPNGADDEAMESRTAITRSLSCQTARRKRSAFSLFRAVFQSFNGSGSTKKKGDGTTPKKAGATTNDSDSGPATSWKSIVDGMRPLRLPGQEVEYYPPPPPPMGNVDVYHDVILAPPSPLVRSGAEGGMTSRYASAEDLHLHDCCEQEVAEADAPPADESDVGSSSPHAIDMQAEEFIAKFYEQFWLQKSESFNSRATE